MTEFEGAGRSLPMVAWRAALRVAVAILVLVGLCVPVLAQGMTPPAVTVVAPPVPRTYVIGATLTFVVTYDQPVTVVTVGGTPGIPFTLGASPVEAGYTGGSGTDNLTFEYTVRAGDADTDGIAVGHSIVLNGGTMRNATGVDAVVTLNGVGSTSGVLVDGYPVHAADDNYPVAEDAALVVMAPGVLANDAGFNLTARLIAGTTRGGLSFSSDGGFQYIPAPNFFGTDSFRVEASNASYADQSIVTITVVPTAPGVAQVFPTQGPIVGGTTVVINGTGFTGVTGVSFGGVMVPVTFVSDTEIMAIAPAGAAAGPVNIQVHRGTASTTLTNGFTYISAGALAVTDGDNFTATGPVGGPFAPAAKTWTLTNNGGTSIDVVVAGPGGVFDLVGAVHGVPFTLAAGSTANVTVSLNAGANGLAAGPVNGSIAFTNQTNGSGSTARQVALDVQQALGTVTIRQDTTGGDAVFGFGSATAALNTSVATVGGTGQSAAISLPAGAYGVTAHDMTGTGYALVGLACSDANSVGDVASRTASIALEAGEAVVCTFKSVNSGAATTALIKDFLSERAGLLLANLPDAQRRIGRLNGVAAGGSALGSTLLGYLPGVVEGRPVTASASLAAIDAMAGNQQPNAFDAWFAGTFSLFDGGTARDRFSGAAVGVDYLLNPDLLVGGFVQVDHLSRGSTTNPATASGTGWLAGPYVTARLSDNLYLDLLAAGGRSTNRVSPLGTYEDGFDATRYLLSAALEGQWTYEEWTFSPRAKLSYFEETSQAYVDAVGTGIPAVTVGLGQLAVGPGVGYRMALDSGVVIDLGLRLEGVLDMANSSGSGFGAAQGRLSGTAGFGLPGGANIGVSARLDGIGSGQGPAGGVGINLSLPAW